RATSFSIPIFYSYTANGLPDFYVFTTTFDLPAGYTNASMNITAMVFDDRGVVELNGTPVASSGIVTNASGLNGQMIFTQGGSPVPWTFDYNYNATTFTPITLGFQTGTNTLEVIVNDTSGGLNYRNGLLSGGYYFFNEV